MTMTTTLIGLFCSLSLTLFSIWRDRRPFDPRRPKLLPYSLISLVAGAVALILAGHLLGLLGMMPARP